MQTWSQLATGTRQNSSNLITVKGEREAFRQGSEQTSKAHSVESKCQKKKRKSQGRNPETQEQTSMANCKEENTPRATRGGGDSSDDSDATRAKHVEATSWKSTRGSQRRSLGEELERISPRQVQPDHRRERKLSQSDIDRMVHEAENYRDDEDDESKIELRMIVRLYV